MPSLSEQPTTHAACSVCGVTYVAGYEGPCQEFLPSATEQQIRFGNPPMCPGSVSLAHLSDGIVATAPLVAPVGKASAR